MRLVKLLLVISCLAAALAASAVEIPFRDGSSVEAESYTMNGSYIMLTMANGRQVAYNAADVDLEALRAAEAAVGANDPAHEPPTGQKPSLEARGSFKAAVAAEGRPKSQVAITDHDVEHVRSASGPQEGDEGNEDQAKIPEGFDQGGVIVVQGMRVEPIEDEDGRFQVTGEVVNRGSGAVTNVSALLSSDSATAAWTATVPVSSIIDAGQTAVFSHEFSMELREGMAAPAVKVSVFYQRTEPAPGTEGASNRRPGGPPPRRPQ